MRASGFDIALDLDQWLEPITRTRKTRDRNPAPKEMVILQGYCSGSALEILNYDQLATYAPTSLKPSDSNHLRSTQLAQTKIAPSKKTSISVFNIVTECMDPCTFGQLVPDDGPYAMLESTGPDFAIAIDESLSSPSSVIEKKSATCSSPA